MSIFVSSTVEAGSFEVSGGGSLGLPAGAVFYFASSSAPTGFLKANGDTVPNGNGTVQGITADFSNLYAVLGTTYGSAGQLPDLRGEFIRGWDDSKGTDNGRTFGSAQSDAITDHNHKVRSEGDSGGDGSNLRNTDGDNNAPTRTSFSTRVTGIGDMITGSSTVIATETRPRNVALLACIKY